MWVRFPLLPQKSVYGVMVASKSPKLRVEVQILVDAHNSGGITIGSLPALDAGGYRPV